MQHPHRRRAVRISVAGSTLLHPVVARDLDLSIVNADRLLSGWPSATTDNNAWQLGIACSRHTSGCGATAAMITLRSQHALEARRLPRDGSPPYSPRNMVPLSRSTALGLTVVVLVGAGCSVPDWPDVAASTSGGAAGSGAAGSAGMGASTGGDATLVLPGPPLAPPPGPTRGEGQGGAVPIADASPNLAGVAGATSGPPSTSTDAGAPPPDASVEPPPTPVDPTEPEPPCGGALVGSFCWYLGAASLACDEVCAIHGGFAAEGAAIVGTPEQGGSIEGCAAVLEALDALPAPVTEGFRDDGLGFGCHVFTNATAATAAWWLSAPALSPEAFGVDVRIACSCVR